MNDSTSKVNQLREEQDEVETRLERERDIWAAEMFELIAEEDNMANYVINYIKYQQLYYKSALEEIEDFMNHINGFISMLIYNDWLSDWMSFIIIISFSFFSFSRIRSIRMSVCFSLCQREIIKRYSKFH